MKAFLMHADRDFAAHAEPATETADVERDLDLAHLLEAMSAGDEVVSRVCRIALLGSPANDFETVLYRQEALRDALAHPELVRTLYALALEALERRKKQHFGYLSNFPSAVLHGAIDTLAIFLDVLARLRDLAASNRKAMRSRAFRTLFETIVAEFGDAYMDEVRGHLAELKFPGGVMVSAVLGDRNEGRDYVLRLARDARPAWLRRVWPDMPRRFTFHLHPRDDAGAQILGQLRDRGIDQAANALAQSADHITAFFAMLGDELAFYVGCLNLRDRLAAIGASFCFPQPQPVGSRTLRFAGLYEPCLALRLQRRIAGNSLSCDGASLIVVTGANQGGKTTFLRSAGLAMLMMQAGMFVAAESYAAEMTAGLQTHFKREEDPAMKRGKLDEELSRMSTVAERVSANWTVLFNESFASTNELEGSEIAGQIVRAMLESRVKVLFVTHLYEFAHHFFVQRRDDAIFLRAARLADGTRPFTLSVGEPLETSYGRDIYQEVFATA